MAVEETAIAPVEKQTVEPTAKREYTLSGDPKCIFGSIGLVLGNCLLNNSTEVDSTMQALTGYLTAVYSIILLAFALSDSYCNASAGSRKMEHFFIIPLLVVVWVAFSTRFLSIIIGK